MTKPIQYNLLIEQWIPVVTLTHKAIFVSLREVLVNAHELRELSAEMPHMNAALLRLLLAILHRIFGPANHQEWKSLWEQKRFDPEALDDYFKSQPYFDLFDPQRPFFQNRHPLIAPDPIQSLRQLIGGGDTFTLFDHIMDETSLAMEPDEAARLLVTAHSFGLAGLRHPKYKLNYTDAPNSRAISFFVEGQNLFETLLFNMIRYNSSEPMPISMQEPDRPVWESPDPYQPERNIPLGYLDYLTWPNRRIMLFPEEVGGKVKVKRVTLAPGLTLLSEFHNPMYHYRKEPGKKQGEENIRIMHFNKDRALWRDSYALLNISDASIEPPKALTWMRELVTHGILPEDMIFQFAAYGMCTEPGKQKVYFYRGERFLFKNRLLKEPSLVGYLGKALDQAEKLRSELWVTLYQLATLLIASKTEEEGGHKPAKEDVQNLIHHWDAEGIYWGQLEIPFYHFLSQLTIDPDKALQVWEDELRTSIWQAYDQTITGIGEEQKAFKASAKTHSRIAYGIKKVLGDRKQEDK